MWGGIGITFAVFHLRATDVTTLDSDEAGILDHIVSSNGAWVPLVNLAPALAVRHLLDLGIVTLWCKDTCGHSLKDGPFVTLTPFGASVRHVVLRERVEGYPRWVDVKRVDQRFRCFRARSWSGVRLMSFPNLVAAQDEREVYMMDESGRRIHLFNSVPITIDPRLTRCKGRSVRVSFSGRSR